MARRLLAPLSIAARRIAARPGSVLLTGFGIAIAAAALTRLLVSQVVVEDRAVEDSIGQLPVERRVLAVSWVGLGTSGWAALDREARKALASLGVGEPVRAVAFRSTRLGTEIVRLAGVDELARRPEVDGLFRTLTWAVPLDGGELNSPAAGEFARRVVEIETALRRESPAFAVHAPLDDVAAAHDRAIRASRRQLVVGGQSIVLFVAFAVLAASAIRRSARETRFRLRRLRALRWQLVLEQVGYAIMVALPAVILRFAAVLLAGGAVGLPALS